MQQLLLTCCVLLLATAVIRGNGQPAASTRDASATPGAVALTWLDKHPPKTSVGVNLGVPWPRGALAPQTSLVVKDAGGNPVPSQIWPLAYWPDGSLKWTGVSVAATPDMGGSLHISAGKNINPSKSINIVEEQGGFIIDTGALTCRIGKKGDCIIDYMEIDGRKVGTQGRLIVIREDRSEDKRGRVTREEEFIGEVTSVTVEQSGPIRAVVRLQGKHKASASHREWLPFNVRLYFTAGLASVKMVHSFEFDGDAQSDFIRGIGMAISVPFREELQNRHVRFSGESGGIWLEPVLMSPSYRDGMVKNALAMRTLQLAGKRIPNLGELDAKAKGHFEGIAVWDDYKLTQLSADSYSIKKRTGAHSAWIKAHDGTRSPGFVYLGDVSGGVGVGMKRFWQKHPAALEINRATEQTGELKIWFWAPDAPAMDLRHYDIKGHEDVISYEDYQPGFSTPEGIANTSELTLWALGATPDAAKAEAMTSASAETPLLVCAPEYYHKTQVFGAWSLPDRSTAENRMVEEQLDRYWSFLHNEVEQRRWYGFWDYGDVMRTYDKGRHEWMYDIGGHAWNNTELLPDTWLWLAFLRTGEARAFRLAEAMTRHTSEVDVHHSGRFAGLGSRHNVIHWGCGAKEARISQAFLKRHYYYLTADERTGDLMREVLAVEDTVGRIQPLRIVLPRPDQPYVLRTGPDWIAFAGNWLTEWERTGDIRYRDYLLAGVRSLESMPEVFKTRLSMGYDPVTKKLFDVGEPSLKTYEFLILFGGDEVAYEIMHLLECPKFEKMWNELMLTWGDRESRASITKPRVAAYAALVTGDPERTKYARTLLMDSIKPHYFPERLPVISGCDTPRAIEEHGVAVPDLSQRALSLIIGREYLRKCEE